MDLAADVGEPALGAFEAFLGAGEFLARGGRRFQSGAGIAVGFRERCLGLGQPVGAGAPFGLGLGDFANQGLALLGENLRRVFKFGAVSFGLGDALVEDGDLAVRAVAAPDPAGLVGGEYRQPPVGHFRLAHDRLLLGAHLGERRALGRDVVAHGGELAFEFGGGRQRCERAFGLGLGGACLVAAGGEARARLGQRRQPRRLAIEVAFARARLAFGVARGFEGRFRGVERCALAVHLGARRDLFGVDFGEAAALRQAPRRPGRGVGCRDIAVPAPQIAFARDQPLAGLERRGKPGAGLAVDHADLRQPAG